MAAVLTVGSFSREKAVVSSTRRQKDPEKSEWRNQPFSVGRMRPENGDVRPEFRDGTLQSCSELV